MESDLVTSLPIIQKLKDLDIENLLKVAEKLYEKYKKRNINK
jgi:hypothetical protein